MTMDDQLSTEDLDTETETEIEEVVVGDTDEEVLRAAGHAADPPTSKPKAKRIRKKLEVVLPTFSMGDTVKWASGAAGTMKEKTGTVIEIVAKGSKPKKYGTATKRPHESYIVLVGDNADVKSNVYWPLVSQLSLVGAAKAAPKAKKPAVEKKEKVVAAKVKPKKEKAVKVAKEKAPKAKKVKAEKAAKAEGSTKTAAEKRAAEERTAAFVKTLKKREEPNDKEEKVLKALRVGSQSTIGELAEKVFSGGNKDGRYLKVKNAIRWLVATKHFKKVDRGTYERLQ